MNRYLLSFGLVAAILILDLAAMPTQLVFAQGAEEVEEVVVTGSRIRRDPLDDTGPVLQVSTEDIERSELTSIGDFLQRLPASGGALNARFNSSGNFGFPPDGSGVGAGSSQVDLRHLNAKRVLVLVDGMRWISESSASGVGSATDLNTIPLAIIDRIEVLGERLPLPADAFMQCGAWNVLHALHESYQALVISWPDRREADTAITENRRGHTKINRWPEFLVPTDLAVVMSMQVDEARRDDRPVGIDVPVGRRLAGPNLADATVGDADGRALGLAAGGANLPETGCSGVGCRKDDRAVIAPARSAQVCRQLRYRGRCAALNRDTFERGLSCCYFVISDLGAVWRKERTVQPGDSGRAGRIGKINQHR